MKMFLILLGLTGVVNITMAGNGEGYLGPITEGKDIGLESVRGISVAALKKSFYNCLVADQSETSAPSVLQSLMTQAYGVDTSTRIRLKKLELNVQENCTFEVPLGPSDNKVGEYKKDSSTCRSYVNGSPGLNDPQLPLSVVNSIHFSAVVDASGFADTQMMRVDYRGFSDVGGRTFMLLLESKKGLYKSLSNSDLPVYSFDNYVDHVIFDDWGEVDEVQTQVEGFRRHTNANYEKNPTILPLKNINTGADTKLFVNGEDLENCLLNELGTIN